MSGAKDLSGPRDLPGHLDWLTFENLPEARDGLINRMWLKAVEQLAGDLDAAPDIKTARTLTLTVTAKPLAVDDAGNLQGVAAAVAVTLKTPKREAALMMEVRQQANGRRGLAFSRTSATNTAQLPLPMDGADDE